MSWNNDIRTYHCYLLVVVIYPLCCYQMNCIWRIRLVTSTSSTIRDWLWVCVFVCGCLWVCYAVLMARNCNFMGSVLQSSTCCTRSGLIFQLHCIATWLLLQRKELLHFILFVTRSAKTRHDCTFFKIPYYGIFIIYIAKAMFWLISASHVINSSPTK